MIRDLAEHNDSLKTITCDVAIIGAGTVGLVIAVLLRRKCLHVVVLESGGREQNGESHLLNEVVQFGMPYSGADKGRFRCLGGTSTRWNAVMIPFSADDLSTIPASWKTRWPIGVDDLTRYTGDVELMFGLPGSSYDVPELATKANTDGPSFLPRLGKWPPFAKRNVASLLRDEIESANGPEIWLNATVTEFLLGPNGKLESLTARSPNEKRLLAKARDVVVAAGAIESTRLLLLADRQHGDMLFKPHGVLGRYFHDHLSTPAAELRVRDRRMLNRTTGYRFEGKAMRHIRFEPGVALRRTQGLPTGFVYISSTSKTPGGFEALRAVLRSRQEGKRPPLRDLARVASHAPWLIRAVWWRFAEKRVLFPAGAKTHMHVVIEQEPRARNQIGLSETRKDTFGNPLATIDWTISDADIDNTVVLAEQFVQFWKKSALAPLADFRLEPKGAIVELMKSGSGFYHPGGSTRMGMDATEGVVDPELRSFAVPNLSVLSTSVFPTGGGANPTMMLLFAAFRLADRFV